MAMKILAVTYINGMMMELLDALIFVNTLPHYTTAIHAVIVPIK